MPYFSIFSTAGLLGVEMIALTGLVICASALLLIVTGMSLKTGVKCAIVGLLLAPQINHWHENAQMLSSVDITVQPDPNDYLYHLWGRDGEYLTELEGDYLVHLATGRTTSVPTPWVHASVAWLDSRFMIRRVKDTGDTAHLEVYDIEHEARYGVPVVGRPSVSFVQPVS